MNRRSVSRLVQATVYALAGVLWALSLALAVKADLVVYDAAGAQMVFVITNATTVLKIDVAQGSGDHQGEYRLTDAALATAGLAAGEYSGRAYNSTAALVNVATMTPVQTLPGFRWTGTAVQDPAATTTPINVDSNGAVLVQPFDLVIDDATQTQLANKNRDVLLGSTLGDFTVTGTVGESLNWQMATLQSSGVFKSTALANIPPSGQPRANFPPDVGFIRVVPRGADGQHIVAQPIPISPGTVGDLNVALDMSQLFGQSNWVKVVGTPTIDGGTIIVASNGPHDWYAYVKLSGVATAGESRIVTVPVTMQTNTTVYVKFKLTVGAN